MIVIIEKKALKAKINRLIELLRSLDNRYDR